MFQWYGKGKLVLNGLMVTLIKFFLLGYLKSEHQSIWDFLEEVYRFTRKGLIHQKKARLNIMMYRFPLY